MHVVWMKSNLQAAIRQRLGSARLGSSGLGWAGLSLSVTSSQRQQKTEIFLFFFI